MKLEPYKNLVLVTNPNMKLADFKQIARYVRNIDSLINIIIIEQGKYNSDLFTEIAKRPTLVFSPWSVQKSMFPRGRIYSGRYIPKDEQVRRLDSKGIPVPRSAVLEPDSRFEESKWGPFVVVKPISALAGSFSRGIEVKKVNQLSYSEIHSKKNDELEDEDKRYLVQEFIDTGEFRPQNRVLTLFGNVLYAEEIRAVQPLATPKEPTTESLQNFIITPVKVERQRAFVYDKDILDLASRVYDVFPDIPLQGIDIIREERSGHLFVLEINAGGNTWHFSSKYGQYQRVEGKKRSAQFDAFRLAASILAKKTKAEAM